MQVLQIKEVIDRRWEELQLVFGHINGQQVAKATKVVWQLLELVAVQLELL